MIHPRFLRIIQIIIDILLIQVGYVLAFLIRYLGEFPEANFPAYLRLIPWISLLSIILFFVYRLYDTVYKRWIEIFSSIIWVTAFIFAGNTALSFMLRQFAFPRTVLVLAAVLHLLLLGFWHYFVWKLEKKIHGRKKVLVVGNVKEAIITAQKIQESTPDLYRVIGLMVPNMDEFNDVSRDIYPVVGDIYSIDHVLKKNKADIIFICPGLSKKDKLFVLNHGMENHCDVSLVPDFYEILIAQARIYQVDDMPVFYINRFFLSSTDLVLKRIFDLFIATLSLIIVAPLIVIISIIIKIDSPGPVFFKQERVGAKGKNFYLYKFRTMIENAEEESGPVLASENDQRITRVGRILRNTRMDELPQLINVLKGEMSIIGPRPERPFFVDQFNKSIEGYDFRHKLKGGITGLAQISGKYSTTAENKLRFDLLYAKNYSPLTDLQILFHTLKVLLIKDKAS